MVLSLVRAERCEQPFIGTRKLQRILAEKGCFIGRDRLFLLLRTHGLLIHKRKRGGTQTTNSRHYFYVYSNLLTNKELTKPNEAWVSDITYIRVGQEFRYLSLIMDAFSRKIVGWCLHHSLAALGPVSALQMALKELPPEARPIHHSDRGIQYCCAEYVKRLEKAGFQISMTEENHCYENAQAERLNGILKYEYGLRDVFQSEQLARQTVRQAVELYNQRRPHQSLNYDIPARFHAQALAA